MNSPIGIVICGLGSAGRSRLQALQLLPEFELKGIVSRRAELATIEFTEALADPAVQVIAISTENADHPLRVRACLNADKHVLCDYPLACSTRELDELLALAQSRKKILHIEQIGLLSIWHDELKKKLATVTKLKAVSYQFTAGSPSFSGPPAFLAYPRLLQLFDWFGDLQLVNYSLDYDQNKYSFAAQWLSSQNIPISFEEKRMSALPRTRVVTLETDTGLTNFSTSPKPEGLFLRDLQYFGKRLHGKNSKPYYDINHVKSLTRILEGLS